MSDTPILGCIFMFAGNFAPRGYALCAGQILPIAQNTALFSLLGTTYGGNGQTTFALPDLRGRSPIGSGQGPGLSNIDLGASGRNRKCDTVEHEHARAHHVPSSGELRIRERRRSRRKSAGGFGHPPVGGRSRLHCRLSERAIKSAID